MTVLRFNDDRHARAFADTLAGGDWLTFYADVQVCIVCQDKAVGNDNNIIPGLNEQVTVPWPEEKISKALGDPEGWDNFFAQAIRSGVVFSHIC